jgi:uncharacterized protein (DUF952 family)
MKWVSALLLFFLSGHALGMDEPVYKILRAQEWKDFSTNGYFAGSKVDLRDGFIHLSPANQVQRIINKYFSDESLIFVVKFSDPSFLKKLIWKPASSGDLYPHLYNASLLTKDIESYEVIKK